MENKMKVSLIIPTFNEAENIERVIGEIPKNIVDEIIVVDCSTDGTADIVKKLGYKLVIQKRKGFGRAFIEGIENSSGDVIIIMDADGSQNPKDLIRLIEGINKGYDCVFATRYTKESHSEDDTLLRSFGNWLITTLVNVLFHMKTSDSLFFYAALKKEVVDKLKLESGGFEICIETITKAYNSGLKIHEIPSIERKRIAGKTKVNDIKHGYLLLKSIFVWRYKLSRLLKERKK